MATRLVSGQGRSGSGTTTIGKGSHQVTFWHPDVGNLHVMTGLDNISWGYELNTANYPTYGGEVVQILSCFVDDLLLQGTLMNYREMEVLTTYFLRYLKLAAADPGRRHLERPMVFEYPQRGYKFNIIVTDLPGYRKSRETVAPEWQLSAFVVDEGDDVESLKQLIIDEANIKAQIGSPDDEHFGLVGRIKFVADNPFSDPIASSGLTFTENAQQSLQHIGDYYSTLLPAYLNGDFDAIFANVGSKPSFSPKLGPKGTNDPLASNQIQISKASKP